MSAHLFRVIIPISVFYDNYNVNVPGIAKLVLFAIGVNMSLMVYVKHFSLQGHSSLTLHMFVQSQYEVSHRTLPLCLMLLWLKVDVFRLV